VSADLTTGTTLASYRIERLLGRGGMGVVYLAEHVRLHRKVALKVLAPDLFDDERFRERFVRESELASSIDHPNIVPIYDADEVDGRLFIAMRYVKGTTLRAVIDHDGPLPVARCLQVLSQVAGALDAAHAQDLVHRDVKPGNILLATPEGAGGDHVYLTDFGITKRTSTAGGITGTGEFLGTVDYVAPEQVQGHEVDGRADLYSLACVAFECLAGAPPFTRDSDIALLWAHVNDAAPPLSGRRSEVPARVDVVMARALAKSPTRPNATCTEFVSELRAAASLPPGAPKRGAGRSPRTLVAAVVAGAVVVLSIATALVARNTPVSSPPDRRSAGGAGVMAIDAGSGDVVTRSPLRIARRSPVFGNRTQPPQLAWIDANGGTLWASVTSGLVAVDAEGGRIATLPLINASGPGLAVAAEEGAVWAAEAPHLQGTGQPGSAADNKLYRIDAENRTVDLDSRLPNRQVLTTGGGFVWVCNGAFVWKVDESTGRPVERIPVSCATTGPTMAYDGRFLWVVTTQGDVARVAPGGSRVVNAPVGDATGVAVGAGGVWVTTTDPTTFASKIVLVNPRTARRVWSLKVGNEATWIAAGGGSVWLSQRLNQRVLRIDPISREVVHAYSSGGYPDVVAIDGGRVWVAY
jgi:hypothetical protein